MKTNFLFIKINLYPEEKNEEIKRKEKEVMYNLKERDYKILYLIFNIILRY